MNRYDEKETYCRKLGHCLSFRYCRSINDKLPCATILDCWFKRLPVGEFLKVHYTRDELIKVFAPPKSKIETLLHAASKAQKSRT